MLSAASHTIREKKDIPNLPNSITDVDSRALDRAFMRNSPEGATTERCFHAYGCRHWLTLRPNTQDDKVLT